MDAEAIFKQAETLRIAGNDQQAAKLFAQLVEIPGIPGGLSSFRLGEIFNRNGHANQALEWHTRAFRSAPNLASRITKAEHLHNGYIYETVNDHRVTDCPICGAPGELWSANNCVTNNDFIPGFNPIREWMMCHSCSHVFAANYPEDIHEVLTNSAPDQWAEPNPGFFRQIAQTVGQITERARGKDLLEVGCGAGEFAGVAAEFGFAVRGLEIRPAYAEAVTRTFGIPVDVEDFLQVADAKKYDVVAMGDVLEHFTVPPADVVAKAASLLNKGGLLYISTPNFMSVFSQVLRDSDPMRRVCEHINYFSRISLEKVLSSGGFTVERYDMSPRYNGSMEVIPTALASDSIGIPKSVAM